jgi:hypothetical protein
MRSAWLPEGLSSQEIAALSRFRAKWIPVRVKKTRQNNNTELGF